MYSPVSSEAVSIPPLRHAIHSSLNFDLDSAQQQTRRGPTGLTEFEVHLADMYVYLEFIIAHILMIVP
jgi:hypothetical protein